MSETEYSPTVSEEGSEPPAEATFSDIESSEEEEAGEGEEEEELPPEEQLEVENATEQLLEEKALTPAAEQESLKAISLVAVSPQFTQPTSEPTPGVFQASEPIPIQPTISYAQPLQQPTISSAPPQILSQPIIPPQPIIQTQQPTISIPL